MKKKLLGIALVALSMIPVTAMAQSASGQCAGKQQTCCVDGKGQRGPRAHKNFDPFRGISNLTDAQRQQLMALRPDCKPGCNATPDSCQTKGQKCDRRDRHNARAQRPDSAAMAARFQAVKEARLNYLKQVQQILTPEQYIQFLENSFTAPRHSKAMKAGKQQRHHAMKAGKQGKRDGKQGKHDGKARKGQKGQQQQKSNS